MATKYERLLADLEEKGTGSMKCFGSSMKPILSNPATCTYVKQDEYKIGDIVFCKVKGRYIDAHKITAKAGNYPRYMISNNHGRSNGWTTRVYGKVVKSVSNSGTVKEFK